MRTSAVRYGKRTAARIRAIRRRAAEWRRRAKRALTLALVTAGTLAAPSWAEAQMGQTAMPATGGIVNRAVAGWQGLNQNGPGWLYYGLNAADRGLGYNGGYMTLGGFIPYAEDDLGGFWAADLRTHLSEYGGFFSNVGAVRKQFLGGTILGIGVYWDYDADALQYPTGGALGTGPLGQFGNVYNQVGISAEWLTDYGNLRSNGYIPVGTTAHTAGAPDFPFYENFVMCQYGLDSALTGTDLEVGLYIPGLADWAGMVSVGGYAYGNSRYDWSAGPQAGRDVVPWFGGVYTRLDMTFIENWDFSLQANNDSYFDWTGFARLTYRMGGSRRRNVPDQMEQPMMRNEHIVRAHQTPLVAMNPDNGNQPWRVIHVNNAAAPDGDGTAGRPFDTLAEGNTAATNAWDIVFVDRGTGTPVGYDTEFRFQAPNQFLVGNGGPFLLNTSTCGLKNITTNTSGNRPVLSNPGGTSVFIDGSQAGGAFVSNLDITGSATGIYATGNLSSAEGRASEVRGVSIAGTAAGQTGVFLDGGSSGKVSGATPLEGAIKFFDTAITDTTLFGLRVSGPSDTKFQADYNGSITTSAAENVVLIDNLTGGRVNLAVGSAPAGSTVPNAVTATGGGGIRLLGNDATTEIAIDNVSLTNTVGNAIFVEQDFAKSTITAGNGTGISRAADGAAIAIIEGAPRLTYEGPITNSRALVPETAAILGGSTTVPTIPPGSPWFTGAQVGEAVEFLDASGAVVGTGVIASVDSVTGAVGVSPATPQGTTQLRREQLSPNPSYLLAVTNVQAPGDIKLLAPIGNPFDDTGDGISISGLQSGANVLVDGATIQSSGANGILVAGSGGNVEFKDIAISGASTAGVAIYEAQPGLTVEFQGLGINLAGSNATGFFAASSSGAPYSILAQGPSNTISTASTKQPAVSIEAAPGAIGGAALNMTFSTVTSGVPAGGNSAMLFGNTASGQFAVTGAFTVNSQTAPTPGTVPADVQPGNVTVLVPPPPTP